MKLAEFDHFCAALPGSAMVVQWGESHVHKIGDKMFALGDAFGDYFVFKATPMTFEVLRAQGLAERAPYLPRGNWLRVAADALPDAELQAHLRQSYELILGKLPKAMRVALRV